MRFLLNDPWFAIHLNVTKRNKEDQPDFIWAPQSKHATYFLFKRLPIPDQIALTFQLQPIMKTLFLALAALAVSTVSAAPEEIGQIIDTVISVGMQVT